VVLAKKKKKEKEKTETADTADDGSFRFYDPTTWTHYFEGWDMFGKEALLAELQQHKEVATPVTSSGRRLRQFELILQWAQTTATMQSWDEVENIVLGKKIVASLRDIVTDENGLDVDELHAALYPLVHTNDKYGVCVAALTKKKKAAEGRKSAPKRTEKRAVECYVCGGPHFASKCTKKKDFRKGGSGSGLTGKKEGTP
jgi:hypothetical protein